MTLNILRNNWLPITVYSLVSLLILWPLLGRGFILTLDMVFTPTLPLPDVVTSSYLFRAGLHMLNIVLPADIIQKLMLLAILLFSGLGMHRLMRNIELSTMHTPIARWAAYASGLLYMINPFTYTRFMVGQYSVLLGYACIPFFVVALLRLLQQPTLRKSIILASWTIAISIISIHTLGLLLVISLIAVVQTMWQYRAHHDKLTQVLKYSLVSLGIFILASSYWLIPLISGNGPTAQSITTFQSSDQAAFDTNGDGAIGKLVHVMRLQGFWADRQDVYLLPQDTIPIWGFAVLSVWVLVCIGTIIAWRHKREIGVLFTSTIVLAALLASGIGTTWLATYIPLFAGYREPQKFTGLIALGFAVFVGFAIPRLFANVKNRISQIVIGLILGVVLISFTPGMFRGFDSQLTPRHYPADWYAVNDQLNKDSQDYQVLFLPWHLYMYYDFAGRVIANPGKDFFNTPVLISDDPEIGTIKPAIADSRKQLATDVLATASSSNTLGHQLTPLNVKYVLLAKDDDYTNYNYLDTQTDLQLISETATLKLYRNTAFQKDRE